MVIKLNMPTDDKQKKDAQPAAANMDSSAQPPKTPEDPTVLKDTSSESLSAVFKALVTQDREARAPFRPTLARLNEIVSKFHAIGSDQVGIELATFEKLREFNLSSKPGGDQSPYYGILSIYDARFLIRIYPDQKVDCYTENLNKPTPTVQSLDSDEFWFKTERSSGGTLKINKAEPKFLRYNLDVQEDAIGFMSAILQTAAACAANEDLKSFDLPAARENTLLPKATSLKPLK